MGPYLWGLDRTIKTSFMISEHSRQIVEKFVLQLKLSGIPVSQVYVFGSQAKGNAHEFSDIDTCIVSTIFGRDRHSERLSLMNLLDHETESIEPHPYSPEGLTDKFDPLANEIRKTGIRIT